MKYKNFIRSSSVRGLMLRRARFAWPLIALMVAIVPVQAGRRAGDSYSVRMQNVTPLQALIRFSMENRLPLGIVLSSQDGLCNATRNIALKTTHVDSVIDALLAGSNYVWSMEAGVVVIKPRALPKSSSYILDLRFERFAAAESTLQELGIMLNGYIQSELHPGEGFAGDILQSPEAEKAGPLELTNVTVEQTTNQIVLQDGKGAWILYPIPDDLAHATDVRRLYLYGYSDDSHALKDLSCVNPSGS